MDFIPDNEDVTKITDEVPAGLPVLPDENTVLEEEITSIAIDSLVTQPVDSNVNNDANRVIHFSDGTMTQAELNMETALGDQSGEVPSSQEQQVALPDNLVEVYRNLGVLGKILTGGSLVTLRVLQAFGSIGDTVIDFLGITRPKYEYEINLAKQMQQEEQARNEKIQGMYSTWQPSDPSQPSTSGQAPVSVPVPMVPPMPPQPSGLSSMATLSEALPQAVPSPYLPLSPSTSYPPPPAASVHLPSQPLPPQSQPAYPAASFVPPLPPAAVSETLPVAPVPVQSQESALLTTQSFSNIPDTPTETVASSPEVPEGLPVNQESNIDLQSQSPPTESSPSDDVDPK